MLEGVNRVSDLSRPQSRVPTGPLLIFAFCLPLLPRPTTGLNGASLVGLAVTFLFVGFFAACLRRPLDRRSARVAGFVLVVIIVMTVIHGIRILYTEDWSETSYLLARVAALMVSLVTYIWLRVSNLPPKSVVKAFLLGYLFLSIFMIVIGVFRLPVFEAVRPSRELGITMPFGKTAGIPRSYGELSILAVLAWAYLLVYRQRLNTLLWSAVAALVCLSVLVAQSRTGLLAWMLVTISFVLLRVTRWPLLARVLLLAAASVPLIAETIVNRTQAPAPISLLVGEKTLQTNVHTRIELDNLAGSLIFSSNLLNAFFGTSRSFWAAASQQVIGQPTELHNHMLAALLFSGVVVGSLFILLCYFVPLWRLASLSSYRDDALLLFIAGIGALFSLQFYEGFFSLTVCLLVGLMWATVWGDEVVPVREAPGSLVSSNRASQ